MLLLDHAAEDPAADAALAAALVARGARAVRAYSPAPTLAFGRLDTRHPRFAQAVEAARDHGFEPVVRAPGGHAAAYHEGTLVLEAVAPDAHAMTGLRDRFDRAAGTLVAALRRLGADARVGPVPGEYCPGDWTVNGGGTVKLAGLAQRQTHGAWLVGAELVVTDGAPIRAVLTDVLGVLELPFEPATAAAVEDLVPGVTVAAARAAVLPGWAALAAPDATATPSGAGRDRPVALVPGRPDAATLAEAQRRRVRHALV